MIANEEMRDKVTLLLVNVSETIILPYFNNLSDQQIDTKSGPDDYVTIADKEAELAITDALLKLIDTSCVIGEEAVALNKNVLSNLKNKVVWTVDPIDGTKNFVNGNNHFCSMIALLENGVTQASWIYVPLTGECYFATQSGVQIKQKQFGTSYKDIINKPINTPDTHKLNCTASLRHLDLSFKNNIREKFKVIENRRFIGSAGIEATMLANAQIEFIFHSITTPWDHAPVHLFTKASGGKSGQISYPELVFREIDFKKNDAVLFVRDVNAWQAVSDFIAH